MAVAGSPAGRPARRWLWLLALLLPLAAGGQVYEMNLNPSRVEGLGGLKPWVNAFLHEADKLPLVFNLLPGTYATGGMIILDGRSLTLRGGGAAYLDAESTSRHFLVQGNGVLQLEGVHLINGNAKKAGGAILARGGANVTVRDATIDNCTATATSSEEAAAGGAIAVGMLANFLLETWQATHQAGVLVYTVALSPDGVRIASAGHGSTLKVWDPESVSAAIGGAQTTGTIPSTSTPTVYSLAWSPSGDRIVTGSGGTGTFPVHVWNSSDLAAGPIANATHGTTVEGVAWSPTGEYIARCGATRPCAHVHLARCLLT